MLFNSYIFVFAFLPCVLLFWYGLNHAGWHVAAQVVLAALSLVFYGYGNPQYIAIILSSVIVNWGISAWMAAAGRRQGRERIRIALGLAGIGFDVGLLFYFKYYDFFVSNVNRLTGAGWALKHIALPLGISFFTFQQISFVADRMMGKAGHYRFFDYLNYVTFFPQLVAGPIVNHKDLVPQFHNVANNRQISYAFRKGVADSDENRLGQGFALFIAGMAKKVLLADKLGGIVDLAYTDVAGLDAASAFAVMLAYTFQIYFDFSGYCDMAVGLGWMLGMELPQNFNSPYKSKSVREFWNRWHMTLNAFFVQYVYIPLGGSRQGMAKKLRNTMIVFLISGIWHGAAWTFVVWGVAHGCMMCLEHLFADRRKISDKLRWLVTFSFVNLAWVLFRSGSVSQAFLFYRRLFSFSWTGKLWQLAESLKASWNYPGLLLFQKICGMEADRYYYLLLLVLLFLAAAVFCIGKNAYEWVENEKHSTHCVWGLALLFAWCVVSFSGVTTFLYFNF